MTLHSSRVRAAAALIGMAALCGACSAFAHDMNDATANANAGAAAASEKIAPVLKQAIPEAPGKNVLIATVTFAPGQDSQPHMHPGSIFAYVTQGHIESQLEGSPAHVYGPGEAWYEPPGAHHIVARNASKTEPAQILVFAIAGEHDPIKKPLPR